MNSNDVEPISSRMTFFYQIVFPILWSGGFGVGTLALWFGDGGSGGDPGLKFQFLGIWILGTAFILWFTRQMYSVQRKGDALVASRFSRRYEIPLELIDEVSATRFWNPKLITIRFRTRPNVPGLIRLMAPMALQIPFGTHPMVTRLRALARSRARP